MLLAGNPLTRNAPICVTVRLPASNRPIGNERCLPCRPIGNNDAFASVSKNRSDVLVPPGGSSKNWPETNANTNSNSKNGNDATACSNASAGAYTEQSPCNRRALLPQSCGRAERLFYSTESVIPLLWRPASIWGIRHCPSGWEGRAVFASGRNARGSEVSDRQPPATLLASPRAANALTAY